MKILITGGAGFIGSNLAEFYLSNNDEVFVVDSLITGSKANIEALLKNPRFHFYQKDVCTFDLSPLPSFDIIYHLASPASPVQYKKYPIETLRVNSEGTYRLLECMKRNKSKIFVLASTSEVYGDPKVHPQTESYWGNVNPVGVRSCYDEGKRFAEALTISYFRKYNLDIRIARIFNTYGPNMEENDGRVISNFVMQALTNKPITVYGNGEQTRSFCYVSDMVQVLSLCGTKPDIAGEIINVGNPEEYSIKEVATIIKKETKSVSEIISKPIDDDDPKQRQPDITKAKKLLGWEPKVTFLEGLHKTLPYFKNRFI